MIVKDEAAVIRRCLESVKPFISGWAIADTGSTDGTQQIIRECLAGIPGELIERPWVNFAHNRNEAIEAAEKQAPDYLLTLDADEVFIREPGFTIDGLTDPIYSARFQMVGTGSIWFRRLLFKPGIRYIGALDEVLDVEDGTRNGVLQCCGVDSYTDGARNRDGMRVKFERDAEVLSKAIETEPESSKLYPRYWFYYAQRLMGAGKYDEAIAAYSKRTQIENGFEEEIFYSLQMIAQCRDQRGDDWRDVARSYQEAFRKRPTRAEPLYALGTLHAAAGEHGLAEIYARAAQRMPRPSGDSLLVDESVYAWRAADLLAGSLAEQGKLSDSLTILEKLLALPQLPESEHERFRENIALIRESIATEQSSAAQMLGPDEAVYAAQGQRVRSGGIKEFRALGREYLQSFNAQTLPSPLRWLWIALVALFGRWVSVAGAVACPVALAWAVAPVANWWAAGIAACTSPLLWIAGRRRLQDAPFAAVALAALGFAFRGNPVALGCSVFALLALKEAGVFTLPLLFAAWAFADQSWLTGATVIGAGSLAAVAAALALFGSMAWPMFRAGAKGHETPYTKDFQQGAPHRLIVDLALVSPVALVAAVTQGATLITTLVAVALTAHMLAPVRNVRLVIAAELLLRVAAATAIVSSPHPIVFACIALAVDLAVIRKLKHVYDPVTAVLAAQLGMSK